MRSIHRAIIVAGLVGSLAAFPPALHRSLRKSNGGAFGFVSPDHCHPRRSSWSPLFAAFEPADAATKSYNRQYLSRTLGVSKDKIDTLSARTGGGNILTLEIGVLEERVEWLTQRLNLKANEMKRIAQQQPTILQHRPEKSLAPKLEYLQARLLLDEASLRKLLLAFPKVLSVSTKDNIQPKLEWLQQRLDLDEAAVGKMIRRWPHLCAYSVEENLAPKLEWLQRRLPLDDAEMSKMIRMQPSLLGCSVEDSLEPKLEWLQRRLALGDAAAAKLLRRCPSIFSKSVANMELKLEWLQQHLSLDDVALSNMIQQFPVLFSCNAETNLRPTLDFYIDALGDTRGALALVVGHPNVLSLSLERRLKPRLQEARGAGIVIDAGCVTRIALFTNEKWSKSLAFQIEQLDIGS